MPLTMTMPASETVSYTTEPQNAEAQDVPDSLSWSASPAALVTLTPDAPPSLACSIKGNGAPGVCRVTVTDGVRSDYVDITLQDMTPATLGLRLLSGPSA